MSRELKFRAWDGEKMHYGVVPWRWDFVISLSWHRCERATGNTISGIGGPEGDFLVPGIRFEELMQWSGFTDKVGKEIWEGDILKRGHGTVGFVKFSSKYGAFDFDFEAETSLQTISTQLSLIISDSEVIGNIYENPELLTQNKV